MGDKVGFDWKWDIFDIGLTVSEYDEPQADCDEEIVDIALDFYRQAHQECKEAGLTSALDDHKTVYTYKEAEKDALSALAAYQLSTLYQAATGEKLSDAMDSVEDNAESNYYYNPYEDVLQYIERHPKYTA